MSADLDNESIPDRGQLLIPGTYPSVVARFDAHALADGPALAVADSHERWSYAELAARSNRLAHWLAQRSVGAGDVVAIFADRSALAVWALLGVMKSGAAFTMLDASYPAARLLEQARIAGATVWVDARRSRTVAADLDAGAASLPHRIDLAGAALDALPTSTPALGIEGDARAYIAFTSGTTGGPKGIVGTHAPLAHFVDWQSRTFALGPSDRCSVLSGLARDPFLRGALTPLAIGASVHLPAPEVRQEPERLAAWLALRASDGGARAALGLLRRRAPARRARPSVPGARLGAARLRRSRRRGARAARAVCRSLRVLAAFANQDVPFDKMVVEINPTRESGRNPIAQVALNLLNLPDMRVALPGLVAERIHGTSTGSKLEFTQ